MMSRAVKLEGKKVALCPINKDDIHILHKWISDLSVTKTTSSSPKIFTFEDEERWFKSITQKKRGEKVLAIIVKKTEKIIGTIGFHKISEVHKRASLGIAIGDKKYWGKGYGREAVALFLDFAFNVLNIHSVWLNVYEFNTRAMRMYKAVGFKEAGRLRETHFWGGKYYNTIKMDILDREFKQSKIKDLILESSKKTNKFS